MKRVLLLAALAALVIGCRSGTEPTPTVTGQWTGSFIAGGNGLSLTLTLQDAGGAVTGSGHLDAAGVSIAWTATGTHVHPNVSLTLTSAGYESVNLSGHCDNASTISATLNGSGFVGNSITLRRVS